MNHHLDIVTFKQLKFPARNQSLWPMGHYQDYNVKRNGVSTPLFCVEVMGPVLSNVIHKLREKIILRKTAHKKMCS